MPLLRLEVDTYEISLTLGKQFNAGVFYVSTMALLFSVSYSSGVEWLLRNFVLQL